MNPNLKTFIYGLILFSIGDTIASAILGGIPSINNFIIISGFTLGGVLADAIGVALVLLIAYKRRIN